MLFAFLLLGTPWFWLFLAIPSLLLIWLVEDERGTTAFITVLLAAAVWVAFGDPKIIPWIIAHPLKVAEYVAAYVGIGIVYGFIKWGFVLWKAQDKYKKFRADYVANYASIRENLIRRELGRKHSNRRDESREASDKRFEDEVAAKLAVQVKGFDKETFKKHLSDQHMTGIQPKTSENKLRIIFWMSYWPFSGIWTLINDPITRFYNFLYRRLGAAFDKMSDHMFKQLKDDLA